jgi:Arc/MetJ-type ribon-helix-helix transcriptional regulator
LKRETICNTIHNMVTKISANVDTELVTFLERYQVKRGLKTRSEALEDAIRELRRAHLRAEYAAAAQDPDYLSDLKRWDSTVADGLDDAY